jgi:hypothetical protein
VIIQTNFDKIIGGFMTVEWKKTDEPDHADLGTFLFYFDQGRLEVFNCEKENQRPYGH